MHFVRDKIVFPSSSDCSESEGGNSMIEKGTVKMGVTKSAPGALLLAASGGGYRGGRQPTPLECALS